MVYDMSVQYFQRDYSDWALYTMLRVFIDKQPHSRRFITESMTVNNIKCQPRAIKVAKSPSSIAKDCHTVSYAWCCNYCDDMIIDYDRWFHGTIKNIPCVLSYIYCITLSLSVYVGSTFISLTQLISGVARWKNIWNAKGQHTVWP